MFNLSDFLWNYHAPSNHAQCIACTLSVKWDPASLANHKRTCPDSSAGERNFFAAFGRNKNIKASDNSSDEEPIVISDYLFDFQKSSRRGTCMACLLQVTWNRKRLREHKIKNCPKVNEKEEKLFKKQKKRQIDSESESDFSDSSSEDSIKKTKKPQLRTQRRIPNSDVQDMQAYSIPPNPAPIKSEDFPVLDPEEDLLVEREIDMSTKKIPQAISIDNTDNFSLLKMENMRLQNESLRLNNELTRLQIEKIKLEITKIKLS